MMAQIKKVGQITLLHEKNIQVTQQYAVGWYDNNNSSQSDQVPGYWRAKTELQDEVRNLKYQEYQRCAISSVTYRSGWMPWSPQNEKQKKSDVRNYYHPKMPRHLRRYHQKYQYPKQQKCQRKSQGNYEKSASVHATTITYLPVGRISYLSGIYPAKTKSNFSLIINRLRSV